MIAPAELRNRQQWLLWGYRPNPKKPGGKPLKVPFYINGTQRWGTQGDQRDRERLTNYTSAIDAVSKARDERVGEFLRYEGVGFAFLPDDGLIGIDLDHMLDEDGVLVPRAVEIMKACNSYTEWSPSKKGLHIFVLGDTAALFDGKRRSFKSNEAGVEVFCGSQFFTFTGDHYDGTPPELAEIPLRVLKRLHATVKGKGRRHANAGAGGTDANDDAGAPSSTSRGRAGVRSLDNDFKRVNDAAMKNLDAWVPQLFPAAVRSSKGYRISSQALGRDLEEDISITSEGIKDFGVHDMGDPREGGRTPIDLVIEWSAAKKPAEALRSLAGMLGIEISAPRAGRKGAQGGGGKAGKGGGDPQDDDPPPDGLPEIRWKQGHLRDCVDQAETALMAMPPEDRVYQRAGMLVRVVRRDSANIRNYKRDPGMLGFQAVDQPYLVEMLTAGAVWRKWDSRSEAWRRINAPEQAAATYLSRTGRWKLPKLWSAISAPTLRPDGTVLQQQGYDEETATWYDPGAVTFPKVPESPTMAQATAALEELRDAFRTFPFAGEADKSVLLSTVLTSLVRRSIPHAPLVCFTAPTSSSGKTMLADCVSIIATGIRAPAMKYPDTDEEAAKAALSALMEGDPIILIDNVERPLQGDWLCTILTSETYRQRVLGRSEMISVPSSSLWLATGNNLVLAGDLRTRSLICRIDPKCEHPEQREFVGDLKEHLAKKRPELVAAGLTVMRAFIAQGERAAKHVKPWGRFEQWTEMVRAPLVWLACDDPCDTIASLEKDDPERGDLLHVLAAWRANFATDAATCRMAIKNALPLVGALSEAGQQMADALRDVCRDRDGSFNPKKLSKWIGRHIGRRVGIEGGDALTFVKGEAVDHTLTYRVEVVKQT